MRLVSVLVPAYNSERWIAAAIESALGQTWKHVEVVVVDDGSTDGTAAVARRYQGERVRVVTQANAGAAAARNRALRECRGDVVQYLDADDVLAPDKVERQLSRLEPGVLCSGEWGTFFTDPQQARFLRDDLWQDLDPVDFLVTAWTKGLMMQTGAWLLTRELAVRAGPWDERLSLDDDGEFFARAILASRGVRFCEGARIYYRFGNTGSLSWGSSPKAIRSNALAANLSSDYLLAAEDSPRTRLAVAQKLIAFAYMTYPQADELVVEAERRIASLGLEATPLPIGGPVLRAVSGLVGWRAAKVLWQPYYLAKLKLGRAAEALIAGNGARTRAERR